MYIIHTSKAVRLKEAKGFQHIFIFILVWEVKDRRHSVWLQLNFSFPHFPAKDEYTENWSWVKWFAHNLEVTLASNTFCWNYHSDILLKFGSFEKSYYIAATILWPNVAVKCSTFWHFQRNAATFRYILT